MYYQAGLPRTGSAIRRDFVLDITCTVVQRMSAAGAYTFAGLNMVEFAQNPTGHNRAFGDCHNPWKAPYRRWLLVGLRRRRRLGHHLRLARLGHGRLDPPARVGVRGDRPQAHADSRLALWCHAAVVLRRQGRPARPKRAGLCCILSVIAGAVPQDHDANEPVPDYETSLTGDLRGVRIGVPTNAFTNIAEPPVMAALKRS